MTDRRSFLGAIAAAPAFGVTTACAQSGVSGAAVSGAIAATSILGFLPEQELALIRAGNSQFDCAPAIRRALADTKGGPLHFPAGTYVVESSIRVLIQETEGKFGPGPWIVGDGMERTVFDSRIADGPMIDIDSDAEHANSFFGVLGVRLESFTITSRRRGAQSTGIRLRSSYQVRIFQVRISAQGADGIHVVCTEGDNDASNMITLEQVRIEDCHGWGIDATPELGLNEISYIRMNQVFIQYCGTQSAAALPSSGGMRYKGQVLHLDQCAFTLNYNVSLYVPGEAGLSQTIELSGTTFENNFARSLLCTGVSGFKARNIQFYNNDIGIAQSACEFSGADNVVRNVDIDGVTVRATAANRLTAFRFSGRHLNRDTCRVRNIAWDNFDYPGQVRCEGLAFDPIPAQGELVVTDWATLLYRPGPDGAASPLRLRGRGSTSGEWVAVQLPEDGVYRGNAGLAPSTRYEVYFWDNNGARALELSVERPVMDKSSGYPVKTGDATRFHVGSVMTDAESKFRTTANGWLNPTSLPGARPGSRLRLWTDGSGRLRALEGAEPRSDTDGRIVSGIPG